MASSSPFTFTDGQIFCEQVNLLKLVKECEDQYNQRMTPLFVYSQDQLRKNVSAYTEALKNSGCHYQLNFSVKANSNLSLLKEFRCLGTSATLVSGNELKLALEAGFDPAHLMLNGGGKCGWETRLAVERGVLINVDSEWDLRQTLDICQHSFPEPRLARVLLRLNLNIDPLVHKYVNTGTLDCKFGLSEDGVETCVQLLEQPGCLVELVGLHSHMGSTIYQTRVFRLCVEQLLNLRQQLVDRGFKSLNILNVGGGLGIDYLEKANETRAWRSEQDKTMTDLLTLRQELQGEAGDKRIQLGDSEQAVVDRVIESLVRYENERISFQELRDEVDKLLTLRPDMRADVERLCPSLTESKISHASPQDLVKSVSDLLQDTGITLMLEPGRSLVANAGVLLARVLGCKQVTNKRFLVTDASMTEVIRPCLYGSYHHITAIPSAPSLVKHVYDVVGPVCESSDFLGKDRLLPENMDGELVVIHDVGAYCHSMSSNYNVRMKPAEVLVDGATWRLIRRADTFQDILAPFQDLD